MRVSTALALLFVLGCSSAATDSTPPATPSASDPAAKRCLSISRIDRSEIVDDSTILFHMRDGAIWRNALPQRCYGLRIQGGFGYTTPLDRLCDLDLIQVLGGSLSVCGLGRFEAYEHPLGVEANEFNAQPD
ncbi:MAG: hypothetical protein P8R42_02440 [Candidatus Binatia bacterium]|nr:hypothetical protein [Candidatus Binatia bacterium]